MANRFIEGWDALTTALLPARDRIVNVQAATSVGAFGRNSGSALRLTNVNGGFDIIFDNQATWIVGFAFKYNILSGGTNVLFSLFDSAVQHICVTVNSSTAQVEIRRGSSSGTLLATSTTVLSASTFYYLEFKFTISDTVGVVQMQTNGVSETLTFVTGNATNQDTRNGGNATANFVEIGNSGNNVSRQFDFDDMYINDGSGSFDNDFWGDIRIVAKSVDGAGNSAQFTPSTGSNWQNVDDTTSDGDTTYNESSTVNHIDSMTTAALGVTGTVKGVGVSVVARKTDAGAGAIAPFWRISGTDYAGTGVAVPTDYVFVTQLYRTHPDGSTAWTTTIIDGAEVGYKRTA